jgi:hypothetical protein
MHIPRALEVSFEPMPKAMRRQAATGISSVIEQNNHLKIS